MGEASRGDADTSWGPAERPRCTAASRHQASEPGHDPRSAANWPARSRRRSSRACLLGAWRSRAAAPAVARPASRPRRCDVLRPDRARRRHEPDHGAHRRASGPMAIPVPVIFWTCSRRRRACWATCGARTSAAFTDVTIGMVATAAGDAGARRPVRGRGARARTAAASCWRPLPGEQHSFGLSMLRTFFRRAGWEVCGEDAAASPRELLRSRAERVARRHRALACSSDVFYSRSRRCMAALRKASRGTRPRLRDGRRPVFPRRIRTCERDRSRCNGLTMRPTPSVRPMHSLASH